MNEEELMEKMEEDMNKYHEKAENNITEGSFFKGKKWGMYKAYNYIEDYLEEEEWEGAMQKYVDIPEYRQYPTAKYKEVDEALENAIEIAEEYNSEYLAEVLSYELGAFYYDNKLEVKTND